MAAAEAMSMTEAASAMAEAMPVMVVAAAAAVAGRRSRRSGLVGRHGRHLRSGSALDPVASVHTFEAALVTPSKRFLFF